MTATQRHLAKRCRDCRQLKPRSAYGASIRSRDRLHSTCHACVRTTTFGGPVAGDPPRRRSIVNPSTWADKYKATP